MKKILIIMMIALLGSAYSQTMVINTNTCYNIITDGENILTLESASDVNYSFVFRLNEVDIIKNFTGNKITDVYKIKSYDVKSGIVKIKTKDNKIISFNYMEDYIIIETSKTTYTCYYIEDDNICAKKMIYK